VADKAGSAGLTIRFRCLAAENAKVSDVLQHLNET